MLAIEITKKNWSDIVQTWYHERML